MPSLKISKKAFHFAPRHFQNINLNEYVRHQDWLKRLAELCDPSDNWRSTEMEFNRHVGPSSSYALKSPLLHSLKFHFAVLSGALKDLNPAFNISQDQQAAIIDKINEEKKSCTPGFHGRIDSLLEGYFSPSSLAELMYCIRYNIVERTANKKTDEVHANNRFFIIAKELGYEVQPKLPNDPYRGAIPIDEIDALITQAFEKQYQPFNILHSLKERIISGFEQYVGIKKEGYTAEFYEPVLERLENLLGEEEPSYDHLILDEETGAITDINWDLVLQKLWNILIKEDYFTYSTWSRTFKTLHLGWLSRFTQSNEEKIIQNAIKAVSLLLAEPEIATPDNISTLSTLLVSEGECFAYLHCNPNLANDIKIALLLNTLDLMLEKNAYYNDDPFWQYISEHPSLIEPFGTRYLAKYARRLEQFSEEITPDRFHLELRDSTLTQLKGLLLKINYLRPHRIGAILHMKSSSGDTALLTAIQASMNHPDIRSSLLELLQKLSENSLEQILSEQNHAGKTLLLMVLSMPGTEKIKVVQQLLPLISTLTDLESLESIVQLNNYRPECNGLLQAITHCPPAVPALLTMMLNYPTDTQNQITTLCLSEVRSTNKLTRCIIELLKLNQKVNALAFTPPQKTAYEKAKLLQESLIQSLEAYYKSSSPPKEGFENLQLKWHEAIKDASDELNKLPDWELFFTNLLLILVSIPLLGMPLALNYYTSNGRHVLFQSNLTYQLDKLDGLVNEVSLVSPV